MQAAEPSEDEHTTPRVLVILALVLDRLVSRNERLINEPGSSSSPRVFDGVRAPSISIPKYLQRMYNYTKCSPSCFVVAYVYIDRLLHRQPQMMLISRNVHRLLVTAVMVASKMLDDEHLDNAFYARVGGVSNAEINRLELELLFLLDFAVTVKAPEFEVYCFYLEHEMARLTADGVALPAASASAMAGDEDEDEDGDIHECKSI